MSMSEIEYPRALDLLKRINTISIQGKEIQEYFMYEGYNFWQAYQTEIFVQTKRFTENPEKTIRELKILHSPSITFSVGAFFASCCASMSAYIRNVDVLIYSVDKKPLGKYRCDFRLEDVYDAVTYSKHHYGEVLYTPSLRSLLRNIWKRRRAAFYTSGFDLFGSYKPNVSQDFFIHAEWDRNIFTDAEQIFVERLVPLLSTYMARVPHRVKWFKRILRILKIKRIYLIDDMWHYFELLVAAKECCVDTYAIQHGHFTKYHVGVLPYSKSLNGSIIKPNRLYVWTEYWRDELIRLGSYLSFADITVAGGKYRNANLSFKTNPQSACIGVLVPYETDVPKEKIKLYLNTLTSSDEFIIYFKPRPDLDTELQLKQYGLEIGSNVQLATQNDIRGVKSITAFGTYTTFLYEMVEQSIPVIVAVDVLDYGDGMVRNGLADPVHTPQELGTAIRNAAFLGPENLKKRRSILIGSDRQNLATFLAKALGE